jgi:tetratricopeptide (TPR) repeat protein
MVDAHQSGPFTSRMPGRNPLVASIVLALALIFGGCLREQIEANQRQLDQQKEDLARLQREVDEMRRNPPPLNYAATPVPPGGCDTDVAREATRRGGESFAAADFTRALGYYQDAVTACPKNPEGELNVARTYEALNDRSRAAAHYQRAIGVAGADQGEPARQARAALARLSASK